MNLESKCSTLIVPNKTLTIMTNQQIETVKRSWRKLEGIDPLLIGDVFYSKLFLDAPYLKKMFTTSKAEQSKKLIDMLHFIVVRLDRIEELSAEIKNLADRHVAYGVKSKHYALVGKSLIWTLKKGSGKDWNEDIEKSWLVCYNELVGVMVD